MLETNFEDGTETWMGFAVTGKGGYPHFERWSCFGRSVLDGDFPPKQSLVMISFNFCEVPLISSSANNRD